MISVDEINLCVKMGVAVLNRRWVIITFFEGVSKMATTYSRIY